MANKKEREKRRKKLERDRLKLKKQIERDEALLASDADIDFEDEILEDELDGVEEDEELEVIEDSIEKSIPVEEASLGGPTSFGELDMVREASAKNEEIQKTAWDVEDLVRNIIYHPLLTPQEKSNAIKAVGNEFSSRVESIMDKPMVKELDMELLEVEAIIAKDLRATPVAERIGNWIEKKVVSSASRNKMPDGNFALVVTRDGKKIRKYLIHDKAHVRAALSRAAQMIKRGGEAASDARAALPKIRAAAKKMGIGTAQKSRSAVIVEKDASDNWRAVMWPSNNFKDLDGEIISEVAHKEYVDWVNRNMEFAPVFMTWHKPGTARENRVDFVAYENGFLLASAPLTEAEAAGLLKAQTVTDIGMSHGSLVYERDPDDSRVITKYRMVEVSDLPLENAANPFTDFQTLIKEAKMNTLEYLSQILGSEEKAKAYLDKTEDKQKALQEAGVENKEVKLEEPQEESTVETKETAPKTDEIVAAVIKELDIPGLQEYLKKTSEALEKVPVLEDLIKELSKDRDDFLAEKIAPPAEKKFLWSRASEDEETILKEDDKTDQELKNAHPESEWDEALGTTSVVN